MCRFCLRHLTTVQTSESECEHPCSTGKENGTASKFTGRSPRGGTKQARSGSSQSYWTSQSSLASPWGIREPIAVYAGNIQMTRQFDTGGPMGKTLLGPRFGNVFICTCHITSSNSPTSGATVLPIKRSPMLI